MSDDIEYAQIVNPNPGEQDTAPGALELAHEALKRSASASRDWRYSKRRNCFDTSQVATDGTLYDAAEIGVLNDSEAPSENECIDLGFAVFARNNIEELARTVLALARENERLRRLLAEACDIAYRGERDTSDSARLDAIAKDGALT